MIRSFRPDKERAKEAAKDKASMNEWQRLIHALGDRNLIPKPMPIESEETSKELDDISRLPANPLPDSVVFVDYASIYENEANADSPNQQISATLPQHSTRQSIANYLQEMPEELTRQVDTSPRRQS